MFFMGAEEPRSEFDPTTVPPVGTSEFEEWLDGVSDDDLGAWLRHYEPPTYPELDLAAMKADLLERVRADRGSGSEGV